ncbi:uncharacterized protein LOC9630674 [Selaginella moellendorffii]|uniref:uncharacterized protein LOC9630674 n=1 Tax=Selaginella moellendorffii TaxID=88036 RepID=UPI000D1C64A3|nr:uncharacterized protein LOC9630674 [Selaginella moellendorffii]XP_024538648.1 uncharacterized protein LOC9630674 [Selaginella moellendorffii]|eukprot:XP_024538643.1 uncharacterized protein LOC9630674 [Selaginella moellendorffii]
MARKIQLTLLGCGGVGRQLLRHIVSTRKLHEDQGLRVAVMAVVDSKSIVLGEKNEELDDTALLEICLAKEKNNQMPAGLNARAVREEDFDATLAAAIRTITEETGRPLVVADCTASEKIGQALAEIADLNCCIVLANKKPLTSSFNVYDRIAALNRRYRCESTVGAALPVIATLNRLLNSGDSIKKIVGALSGTLGFVMSRLEYGESFSDIVRQAKELGYTEPDPRDDLGGMDVARKALIMARLMGWRINLEDVEVECLYPPSLAPKLMSTMQFLKEGLAELDLPMRNRVKEAAARGCVLRYVATIENFHCKVGIVEQPQQSALGQLHGSDNLVEIFTRCYSTSPLVIKGAGAGNDTTAAGVLADVLDLQDYFG